MDLTDLGIPALVPANQTSATQAAPLVPNPLTSQPSPLTTPQVGQVAPPQMANLTTQPSPLLGMQQQQLPSGSITVSNGPTTTLTAASAAHTTRASLTSALSTLGGLASTAATTAAAVALGSNQPGKNPVGGFQDTNQFAIQAQLQANIDNMNAGLNANAGGYANPLANGGLSSNGTLNTINSAMPTTNAATAAVGGAGGLTTSTTTGTNITIQNAQNTMAMPPPPQQGGMPATLAPTVHDGIDRSQPLWCQITGTETKLSFLLQEYTEFKILVHDFGRNRSVGHRFSEFQTLHDNLSPLDLNIPPLPPTGLDSTDSRVVADRIVKLTAFLTYCLQSEPIRLEKQLHLWRFLDFEGNAGLSIARFTLATSSQGNNAVRDSLFRTLPKLTEAPAGSEEGQRYAADLYRLSHPSTMNASIDHVMGLGVTNLVNGSPPHLLGACQLLAGAVKTGGLDAVNLMLGREGFLLRLLQLLGGAENFPAVRTLLSSFLVTSGKDFPSVMTPTLIRAAIPVIHPLLAQGRSPVHVHELLAKLIWFALDQELRDFLFADVGAAQGQSSALAAVIVPLFQSPDRNTQILAVLISAAAIIEGSADEMRAGELQRKMQQVWTELGLDESGSSSNNDGAVGNRGTVAIGQQQNGPNASATVDDPNLLKLTASLCMPNSLARVAILLGDNRFAHYGMWLLRKANPNLKNLQMIQGKLTKILEEPDHPCRGQAAELLLRVQEPDLSNIEGLPSYEQALERAILDPLGLSLRQSYEEVGQMKSTTAHHALKVTQAFQNPISLPKSHSCPGYPHPNGVFQKFDESLQLYIGVREELKQTVAANDQFAQSLLQLTEQAVMEQNGTGSSAAAGGIGVTDPNAGSRFSEVNRKAYLERISKLETNAVSAKQKKEKYMEDDRVLTAVTQELQTAMASCQEIEKAYEQTNNEVQQKQRLAEQARTISAQKRQKLAEVESQGLGGVQNQVVQMKQRLEQVQERQKTLALLHMKIAQGDIGMDISSYLTEPGLSVAHMGKVHQVKTEHAHWKQQETLLGQQIQQLEAHSMQINPERLRQEIQQLDAQITDAENALNTLLLPRLNQQLAPDLQNKRAILQQVQQKHATARQERDSSSAMATNEERMATQAMDSVKRELQQRHQALSALMARQREIRMRCTVLDGKIQGVVSLLDRGEKDRRNVVRSAGQELVKTLTQFIDGDLGTSILDNESFAVGTITGTSNLTAAQVPQPDIQAPVSVLPTQPVLTQQPQFQPQAPNPVPVQPVVTQFQQPIVQQQPIGQPIPGLQPPTTAAASSKTSNIFDDADNDGPAFANSKPQTVTQSSGMNSPSAASQISSQPQLTSVPSVTSQPAAVPGVVQQQFTPTAAASQVPEVAPQIIAQQPQAPVLVAQVTPVAAPVSVETPVAAAQQPVQPIVQQQLSPTLPGTVSPSQGAGQAAPVNTVVPGTVSPSQGAGQAAPAKLTTVPPVMLPTTQAPVADNHTTTAVKAAEDIFNDEFFS